jgi:hypothetical protein
LYETNPDYCNEMLLKLHMHADRHFKHKYHGFFRKYIKEEWQKKAMARRRRGKNGTALWAFARYYLSDPRGVKAGDWEAFLDARVGHD